MRKPLLFISQFFLANKIGSIIPSSKSLSKKMAEFSHGENILEVGAGTGVITEFLVKDKTRKLTVLEPNQTFFNQIKKFESKNVKILNSMIEKFDKRNFDSIVCSIPFNSLSEEENFKIFAKISKMLKNDDSSLIFFEYTKFSNIRKNKIVIDIKKKAKKIRVYKNIPPADVIIISKKQLKEVFMGI